MSAINRSIDNIGCRTQVAGDARMVVASMPLLNAGLGFATTMLLAHLLSFEYFGFYMNWTYAASILAMISSLGLPSANSYTAATNLHLLPRIYGYSLAVSLTLGCAAGGLLYVYAGSDGPAVPLWVRIALVAIVPLSATLSSIRGVLLGSRQYLVYVWSGGAQGVLQFLSVFLLVISIANSAKAFEIALFTYAAGFLVALAVSLSGVKRIAPPSYRLLSKFFPYSLPLWIHSIFMVLLQRSELVVLAMLLSPAEVGLFALAAKLADSLSYAPQGLALALFTDFAQSSVVTAHRVAGTAIRVVLLFAAVAGVLLYGVCVGVLPLFVPKVSATLGLLPVLLLATAAMGPIYIFGSLAQAVGQSQTVLFITVSAFSFKLVLLTLAVMIGGVDAAPVAILIAAIASLAVAAWKVSRNTNHSLLEFFTPQRGDWGLAWRFIESSWRKTG